VYGYVMEVRILQVSNSALCTSCIRH